jgi:hypothetical protein
MSENVLSLKHLQELFSIRLFFRRNHATAAKGQLSRRVETSFRTTEAQESANLGQILAWDPVGFGGGAER